METVQLSPQGPRLSRLIYGAWRLSDSVDTTTGATLKKIHACLEQGITTIDHADIYGNYSCEKLFGDAIRQEPALKRQIQVVTKCCIMLMSSRFPDRKVKHYDTSAAHIEASVETSLKNLGIDVIDVLLLHRPDPLMDAAETGACLDRLVASGKVRAVGVSNFKPWDCELLQANMRTPLIANQLEMSLLTQDAFVNGDLAFAGRRSMAAMAWSPLGGGALFGDSVAALRVRPLLMKVAQAFGVSMDAVALAWLLAHPSRILPVAGTNNLARIRALGDCFKVKLDRETWFELSSAALGHEVA